MVPKDVNNKLPLMQADYKAKEGTPFKHFFCPLLFKDEDVELCMGHVVPQSYPNCSGARVVQRFDVDSFYGRIAEADFGVLLEAREKGLKGVLLDRKLYSAMRPQVVVDGETIPHYPFHSEDTRDPTIHA